MKLSVKAMSKKATISSILMFQTNDTSLYWREPLFRVYPFLDKDKGLNASWRDRKKYLAAELSQYYIQIKDELQKKVDTFNAHWLNNQENIIKIFTDVFNINCYNLFNDMLAEVSLNPICPRDINKNSFTVFYKSDETRFLETALHEIVHFVWFYIWQQHFKDDSKEYESPHLKWVLSEMVVDTFVNNTDIGEFFSPQRRNSCVYRYFYTMQINNVPILQMLSNIYQNLLTLTHFMETAYKYCQDNESEIRKQML